MVGKRNGHRCLTRTPANMCGVRITDISRSCNAWRQRQRGSSGRKLLALTPTGAAYNVLNELLQVAVLDLLNAIGQYDKPAIDFIQFAPLKLVSQLFATQSQRMPPRMLAQHQA